MLDHFSKVFSLMYSLKLQLTELQTDIILHRLQYSPWGPHSSFFHWVHDAILLVWLIVKHKLNPSAVVLSILPSNSKSGVHWLKLWKRNVRKNLKLGGDSNRGPPGRQADVKTTKLWWIPHFKFFNILLPQKIFLLEIEILFWHELKILSFNWQRISNLKSYKYELGPGRLASLEDKCALRNFLFCHTVVWNTP